MFIYFYYSIVRRPLLRTPRAFR